MDSEDLMLLNDIALIDQHLQISSIDSASNAQKTLDGNVSSHVEEGPSSRIDANTPKDLNLSCQNVLREIEKKLLEILDENLEKQKTIVNYLKDSNKKSESADDSGVGQLVRCAGIFYFKDFYGYPQPRNEDVKEKLSYGELLCADYLTNSCGWSKHDKECLTKAVLKESQHGETSKAVGDSLKEKKKNSLELEKSIDWMKISATDMNGKYSPSECEAQWKLHLSPAVNKKKWSVSEIEKLNALAKKYRYQNWDDIANELGTNRSGYQCCIQYQTKNSLNEGKWSAEEDACLKELVDKFKINNQIPWTKISWFFQTRSRKQCQDRYLEHLRKDLKRGQFSAAEDKIIIFGAKIFKDFGKLAKFLPGRAPTQIRSRYYYLIGLAMSEFTKEEDEYLLSLVKEHGANWLKISKHFQNRSKLQCRKRYGVLRKLVSETPVPDLSVENCNSKKYCQNFMKIKKPEKAKARKATRPEEHDIYNEMLNYHENCSENYFGPRLRNPASEEQLTDLALKLRTTMAMLSVSCDFSQKTEIIESLKNNCNFESYDIKLLKKLAEEDASGNATLADNYFLHGMLIPPNRGTLTGCQTMLLSRTRIRLRTCEAEGLPQTSDQRTATTKDDSRRVSSSTAEALFKSRMKSLFLLPILLSRIPTAGLCQEFYHKGKTKKPKKMTKKRLRNHAREMNAAHREKRKRLAEESAGKQSALEVEESTSGQENTSNVECQEGPAKRKARKLY